jgi:hypothetical protein
VRAVQWPYGPRGLTCDAGGHKNLQRAELSRRIVRPGTLIQEMSRASPKVELNSPSGARAGLKLSKSVQVRTTARRVVSELA